MKVSTISLGGIFVHTLPALITSYAAKSIATTIYEKEHLSARLSQVDIVAIADLNGAKYILDSIQYTVHDNIELASYIHDANVRLHRVLSIGISEVLLPPLSEEVKLGLRQAAANLNLFSIYAEVYLAATSWAIGDRLATQRYLTSALEKASAVASAKSSPSQMVEEEERIEINGSANATIRWSYSGLRPDVGTPGHLVQDINVARDVVLGKDPTPGDIYRKWSQHIDSHLT